MKLKAQHWASSEVMTYCSKEESLCKISVVVFCCVIWVLYIVWILTPYQRCGLQMFSPIPWVTISFCWLFLLLCRSILFWCSLIYSLFRHHIQEVTVKTQVKEAFAYVFSWEFYGFRPYIWVLISFCVSFCEWYKIRVSFHSLAWNIWFPLYSLLMKLSELAFF